MNCPICHTPLRDTNYLRSHLTENHSDSQLQLSLRECPEVCHTSPSRAKVSFEFTREAEELLSQLNSARQLHSQNLLSQRQALSTLSKSLYPAGETTSSTHSESPNTEFNFSGKNLEQHCSGTLGQVIQDDPSSRECKQHHRSSQWHRPVLAAPLLNGDGIIPLRRSYKHSCHRTLLHRGCLASSTPITDRTDEIGDSKYCRRMRRLEASLAEKSLEVAELTQRLRQDVEELENRERLITSMRGFLQEMPEEHLVASAGVESNSEVNLLEDSIPDRSNSRQVYHRGTPVSSLRNKMHSLHLDDNSPGHEEDYESLQEASTQKRDRLFASPSRCLVGAEKLDLSERGTQTPSPFSDSSHSRASSRKSGKCSTGMTKRRVKSSSLGSISGDSRFSTQRQDKHECLSGSTRTRSARKPRKTDEVRCEEAYQRLNGDCGSSNRSTGESSRTSTGEYSPELQWLLHQQHLLQKEFYQELTNLLDHIDRMHDRTGFDKIS